MLCSTKCLKGLFWAVLSLLTPATHSIMHTEPRLIQGFSESLLLLHICTHHPSHLLLYSGCLTECVSNSVSISFFSFPLKVKYRLLGFS